VYLINNLTQKFILLGFVTLLVACDDKSVNEKSESDLPDSSDQINVQKGTGQVLEITFGGNGGNGNVRLSTGAGCDSTDTVNRCISRIISDTIITLDPQPDNNSIFNGFELDSDCADNEVFMDTKKVCKAIFDVKSTTQKYALTIALHGNSSDSATVTSNSGEINCGVSCVETYNSGTSVILTADTTNQNTTISWSGDCTGNATTTTVKMTALKKCIATFNPELTPLNIQVQSVPFTPGDQPAAPAAPEN